MSKGKYDEEIKITFPDCWAVLDKYKICVDISKSIFEMKKSSKFIEQIHDNDGHIDELIAHTIATDYLSYLERPLTDAIKRRLKVERYGSER